MDKMVKLIKPFFKRVLPSLLLPSLILTAPFAHAESSTPQEIIIAADDWCPYNCDPNSETPGYMVEIAKEALEAVSPGQYRVTYIQRPWERAMRMARIGQQVHGIIGAIASEAEGLHIPDEAQGLMFVKLFTKKGNPWTFSDTAQMKKDNILLGAVSGYDYAENISNYIKDYPENVKLVYGDPPLPKLLNLINLKRIDTLIEDQAVFWYNIKALGYNPDDFSVAGSIDQPQKLFLAFHDKNIAEQVGKGTKLLRENGRLAKILEKYNIQDWK